MTLLHYPQEEPQPASQTPPPAGPTEGSILLYLPVALSQGPDGGYMLEDQACNGLRLWAEEFERLLVMLPLSPEPAPPSWVPVGRIGPALERIEFIPLPTAWRPDQFLRQLPRTRRRIRELLPRADWLGFAIGGLFGDWGAVAAFEARRQNRAHYVWADRVESEVMRLRAGTAAKLRHRILAGLYHRPMARLEHNLVRHADLGLFHGRDTYDTYAASSPNPQLVHDIHIKSEDHLSPEALAAKVAGLREGPLRIVYTGRAEPMKGPFDWIETLRLLAASGVDFQATWAGEGSDLAEMQRRIEAEKLQHRVSLPGFITDRGQLMQLLREAHLMLFCHKTPESPRCLIEALISATPLIGYDSPYPRDLIAGHGGGQLSETRSPAALAQILASLAARRETLADLVSSAARDGAQFSDEAVFRHRADLIRQHLPKRGPGQTRKA